MRKMKKILAFVMAMAMVLGMSATVFAELAENQQKASGTAKDRGTITVEGIDPEFSEEDSSVSNVKVTAYQIIKAKYENNDTSFVGYESLYTSLTISDEENKGVSVTEDDLNAIIKEMEFKNGVPINLADGTSKIELSYKDGKYSASNLPVGSYLVVVSGADAKIYSPIVVSIFYVAAEQSDNVTENGSVNIVNGNAWVKVSNTPDVDKIATPKSDIVIEDYDNKSVNVGDEIDYQVVINPVPYYGGKNPVFKLTDTLSNGLTLKGGVNGIKVKKATVVEGKVTVGEELAASEYAYSIDVAGQTITVDFVSETDGYVLNELQGHALVVEYTAEVTEDAKFNGESNDNNVTLNFSRDSNIEGSDEKKTVKTYNYMFDLSAMVNGSETDSMVTKVGVVIGDTKTTPLPGAEFTLYTDAECVNEYKNDIMTSGVVISKETTGAMVIRGLSVGTYYMKETKAPQGYSLNDHVYKIEITAAYYDDFTQNDGNGVPVTHKGKLSSYEIKVDESIIITGTGDERNKLGVITVEKGNVYQETIDGDENDNYGGTDTFEIKNTKLSSLPSTGGIGTTIFTIGGCAIMIIAAGLFFATRRKAEK